MPRRDVVRQEVNNIRERTREHQRRSTENAASEMAVGTLSVIPGIRYHNIGWAQYSSLQDSKTCPYCLRLDGMVLSVDHEDYTSGRYDPPQHPRCRCSWVKISREEEGVEEDWSPPSAAERERYIRHVPGIKKRFDERGWQRLSERVLRVIKFGEKLWI